MAFAVNRAAKQWRRSGTKKVNTPPHPFDDTFDSAETGESSFTSGDEEENLTVSLFVEEEEEEGLQTPLSGIKYWAVKRPTVTTPPNLTNDAPQDPDDRSCIEATLSGIRQGQPSDVGVKLASTKTELTSFLITHDPDERSCIEATVDGVALEQPVKEKGAIATGGEEGVEINLNDYKKATRLILLDLKGAEVETSGKKVVRFEIDGKEATQRTSATQRRRKLLKFLRKKSKAPTKPVGCPQLMQMTAVKPTTCLKETPRYETDSSKGGSKSLDERSHELSGIVIELYNSFLGAVVESYFLCQSTAAYLEKQVPDCADTELLRELLDDIAVGASDEIEETNDESFEELRDDDNKGTPQVISVRKSSRRSGTKPWDENS